MTPIEMMLTRNFILEEVGIGMIGVLVCIVAPLMPKGKEGLACLLFLLIGVWKSVMGARSGRAARRMQAQEDAIQPLHEPHA